MARNSLQSGWYNIKLPADLIRRCYYVREQLREKYGILKPITVLVKEGTEMNLRAIEELYFPPREEEQYGGDSKDFTRNKRCY